MKYENKWFYSKHYNISEREGIACPVLFAPYVNHETSMFPFGMPVEDMYLYNNFVIDNAYFDNIVNLLDRNLKKIENILSEISIYSIENTTFCHIYMNDKKQVKFVITNVLNSNNDIELSFIFASFEEAGKYRDMVEEYIKEAFRTYFQNEDVKND